MIQAVDHAERPRDYPGFARAALAMGYSIDFRYLCWPWGGRPGREINDWKVARPEEVAAALEAGLSVSLIWQDTKRDSDAGYAGGLRNGREARRQAEALGYPRGLTIDVVLADYDAPMADVSRTIEPYARGFLDGLEGAYRMAGYGKRVIIEECLRRGFIEWGHQSAGWTGGVDSPHPGMRALQRMGYVYPAGVECDWNVVHGDLGEWRAPNVGRVTWLDGFEKIDVGPDGGTWADDRSPVRGVLHTTEGSWDASMAVFRNKGVPPHVMVDPVSKRRAQFVPLDRSSYALVNAPGGVETNREHAIQVEIVGSAAKMPDLPDDQLRWLAEEVVRPLSDACGIPLVAPEFTDRDHVQRMTFDQWRSFSGWCGHQHVPENVHWDPGALDAHRLLAYAGGHAEETEAVNTLVIPSWAAPQSGRWPNFRLSEWGPGTAQIVAQPGAPFAPGLDKIAAPKFAYRPPFLWMSVLEITGMKDIGGNPSTVAGIEEAPNGSVVLCTIDGATFEIARRP